jgi:hypothetical protein
MSDEVIHVGGVSYYWKFFHLPEFRRLYLAVEHAMLSQVPDGLPPAYAARLDLLQRELGYVGLSDADAADLVWHHLETDRGLSADTVGKVLSRAPQPQRQP